MTRTVASTPYPFPLSGRLEPGTTALAVIDMQTDFCGAGGYIDRMGLDLAPLRAPIEPIRRVLAAMRDAGFTVVHTRETFRPDMSDVQPHRRFRGAAGDAVVVGDEGPLGRCLIAGEAVLGHHRRARAARRRGGLRQERLWRLRHHRHRHVPQARGIENLVLTGVTTNCCIQSNLREALDRGYDCVVLEDCCGAVTAASHERAMAMIAGADGVFGTVATAQAMIDALK